MKFWESRFVKITVKVLDFFARIALMLPVIKKLPLNFIRFFIVGSADFLFELLLLLFLVDIVHLPLIPILSVIYLPNLLTTIVGSFTGYTLNKAWSFEDNTDNVAKQFGKYVAVVIFNIALNNIFFGFWFGTVFSSLTDNVVLSSTAAKILATSFQVITSYLAYKHIVFRKDKEVLTEVTV